MRAVMRAGYAIRRRLLALTRWPTRGVKAMAFDPEGRLPPVWFQDARPEPAGPQRWHLDVNVAPETVERRVRDAIDAGGVLVSDANAPAFWVLADSQGNHACLCTALGRTGDA